MLYAVKIEVFFCYEPFVYFIPDPPFDVFLVEQKTTPKLQNFLALDQTKEQTRKKRSNWYSTYMHSICICLFAVLQSTSQAAGTGQKRKRGLEDAVTEDESASTAPGGASSISTLARTGVNLSSWGPPGPPLILCTFRSTHEKASKGFIETKVSEVDSLHHLPKEPI